MGSERLLGGRGGLSGSMLRAWPGPLVKDRTSPDGYGDHIGCAVTALLLAQAELRRLDQFGKGGDDITGAHPHGGLREPGRRDLRRNAARGGIRIRHNDEPQLPQRVTSFPVRAARASSQVGRCSGWAGMMARWLFAAARALGEP